ncbi:MAG: hypothetical protein ACLQBD_15065 [Syntrophobacteraceae bacterium]
MNAISASILIALIAVVSAAPRRWALLGMGAGVLYLTQGTSIDVLGFNLFPMRFLEMACFVRVTVRREFNFSNLNELDILFLLLYGYITVAFLLRSTEGQAYQIGLAVDATLCYFIFRGLARDIADLRWFLRAFAVLLIPYVALLFVEMVTNKNLFSLLGGGSMAEYFREGRIRCTGSFRHPSLLGTLGASFLPLYIGIAAGKRERTWGCIGIALCAAIALLANSGGPIGAVAVGLTGWFLWPMRTKMRNVRRGIVGSLILLALSMKAPVWYLPTKFGILTGGDAWHRSRLMDMAAQNIGKWWLWGMSVSQTADWLPYHLSTGGADITNQFLCFGLAAGLLAIILFILLLVVCFKSLGKAMRITRTSFSKPAETEFMLWGLGVTLAVHIENWFSISYFDQTYVVWFMQLAMIVTISQMCIRSNGRERAKLLMFLRCKGSPRPLARYAPVKRM